MKMSHTPLCSKNLNLTEPFKDSQLIHYGSNLKSEKIIKTWVNNLELLFAASYVIRLGQKKFQPKLLYFFFFVLISV